MSILTARDTRTILDSLRDIEALTLTMRKVVRAPTVSELYPASAAVDVIRNILLGASLSDLEVEAVTAGELEPKPVESARAA